MASADDRYWAQYDGLQHAKHQLLTSYLGGWFPILASWTGRVLYIDCHAGRGRHDTGHEGSPLLALRSLLEHRQCDQILRATQVRFEFFEINRKNYDTLMREISALGTLPGNVQVNCYHADYESRLRATVDFMRSRGSQLAPSFAFVDPYGFSLSMDLLNDLLSFPTSELLINFMYRYVDMAIHQPSQASLMDSLFGSPLWRQLASIDDPIRRSKETIALFSKQLKADYVTHMDMRAENGALKYVLIHATNHRKGREVMKRAMWSVTPDGSFTAFERHTPNQMVLIRPDPDLTPLKRALWNQFAGKQVTMRDIHEWLVDQIYLPRHLHEVLRDYRAKSLISASGYKGSFAFNKNPTISFQVTPPTSL